MSSSLSSRDVLRRGNSALLLLDRFIEEHSSAIMFGILLLYFGRAFFVSRATDMTADELLTYSEAQLPSLHALWWTLKNIPTALDPPLHPFLSFFSFRLPLSFPLSLRVPAIVAYGAMILSLFVFLRKRAPAAIALIAATVPMLVGVFPFAVQARPYALVLAFSGWALVFWQRAAERRSGRIGAFIGLYLCLTCALLSQYLAGLVFVPLVAGELWRSLRHRIDPAIWVVFAAAGLAVLSYIPFLPAGDLYRAYPWHGVFTWDLEETYLLGISPIILVVLSLCALLWLTYQDADYRGPTVRLPEHEAVAIAAFYFVPFMAFAVAKIFTHSYVARYSLMFMIAASIVIGILIYLLTRHVRGLASAILIVLLMYAGLPIAKGLAHSGAQNTNGISSSKLSILNTHPALPVAVTNYNDYGRLYLFGPDRLKRRMMLVFDPSAITEYGNNVGLATEAVRRALHAPGEHYNEFVKSHSRFLLLGTDWMRDRLLHQGWKVVLLGNVFHWDLYYVAKPGREPDASAARR